MTHILPLLQPLRSAMIIGFLVAGGLSQAEAASSAWATSDGGRMRLIVLPPAPDGTRQAGLQIEPKPDWFTYWREPGDSGIPPQITPEPGSKTTLSALTFPVPKRVDLGKVRDIGYDSPVVFPFTLTNAETEQQKPLKITAFIGMCHNICIPFQAELSVDLSHSETTDINEEQLIDKAKSRLPATPTDDFLVSGFQMADDLSSLDVDLRLPEGSKDAPRILVTGPEGYLFTDYQTLTRTGTRLALRITLSKLPRNYSVAGKTWHILVAAGGKRVMEAPLAFGATHPIVKP
ncbi:protein-disulfide reductase DsbD domain-containing protein [Rhizobium sp.]|jgi:DsbC/DsbD-like thiol-disulfide interchange protein|uniref:protein-disulfide reductase DsbD domain-containing protein n=1 Tax=Rhizobium sp. TaxID=391 RepID=UPI000E96C078|nr:cytochrome C biogenesis protein [Rhizobium sp.]